eukprot:jgi/Chrzof1/12648/Cz07g02090.t1
MTTDDIEVDCMPAIYNWAGAQVQGTYWNLLRRHQHHSYRNEPIALFSDVARQQLVGIITNQLQRLMQLVEEVPSSGDLEIRTSPDHATSLKHAIRCSLALLHRLVPMEDVSIDFPAADVELINDKVSEVEVCIYEHCRGALGATVVVRPDDALGRRLVTFVRVVGWQGMMAVLECKYHNAHPPSGDLFPL